MVKFLRRIWSRYSKLGKKRKKKQVWRRPTGRDNKMREKRKGYPKTVSIGYKKSKEKKIGVVTINNLDDLKKIKEKDIVKLGRLGKKKKIQVTQKAKEMKISIQNLNVKKFLEKNKKSSASKDEAKDKKIKTKEKQK